LPPNHKLDSFASDFMIQVGRDTGAPLRPSLLQIPDEDLGHGRPLLAIDNDVEAPTPVTRIAIAIRPRRPWPGPVTSPGTQRSRGPQIRPAARAQRPHPSNDGLPERMLLHSRGQGSLVRS